MKKNKKLLNIIIILISAIIVVLLFYILFSKKSEVTFTINERNIKLKLGETKRISYQLNVPNLKVTWSSNSDNITINKNGEIDASTYGQAKITGTVIYNNKKYIDTSIVDVYTGEIGVPIESISAPMGYILMKPNSEFDLSFTVNPSNAYIYSIDYYSSNESIVSVSNNKIISKNNGSATISLVVNNQIVKDVMIKVSNDIKENTIAKDIESIVFDENDIEIEMGDIKVLTYYPNPKDSYVETIEWFSSNEDIVSVSEGVIKGINIGEATIKITINNKVSSTLNVIVKASKAELVIDYSPKTTIRIGEKTLIKAHINPTNINDRIEYKSSNPSIAKVENGTITGLAAGNTTITLSISNGKTKTFIINVLPQKGSFSGSLNLWGYHSLNAKTPVLADKIFFQKLASSGIGLLQNNTYIINSSDGSFSYDISTNLLSINNKRIKVRIYYPPGEDLSTLNTLTYMGGRGETNFGGIFTDIAKNASIAKSAGILILLAEGNNTSFDGDSGAYTTQFVKAITKQKGNVKNSILGFSDGAHKVMHASNKMFYDRIIVFSGYTDGVDSLDKAKNSEVMFIIAPNDGNYKQAQSALRHMKSSGYNNVTVISNGSDMPNLFSDKFLVITPGSLMKNGHLTENILLSGMIEYLND